MKSFFLYASVLLLALCGCSDRNANKAKVVVYTSLDRPFSEPIFAEFTKKTGILVEAVYDSEATKTVGLANRLVAEKSNPRADVFWNSEVLRTIVLKNKGVLTPYISSESAEIPSIYKDSEGYWTGFAARARVFLYNTDLIDEPPSSFLELSQEEWKGKFAMANPLFGTTSTHVAALQGEMGPTKAREYLLALRDNELFLAAGNAHARDLVVSGEVPVCITDTDDAWGPIANGKPVSMSIPDQANDEMGILLIPNTVSLIAGAPHVENGKVLIDYLLSKDVESLLAYAGSAQIPVRAGVDKPKSVLDISKLKLMEVDFDALAESVDDSSLWIQEVFLNK